MCLYGNSYNRLTTLLQVLHWFFTSHFTQIPEYDGFKVFSMYTFHGTGESDQNLLSQEAFEFQDR